MILEQLMIEVGLLIGLFDDVLEDSIAVDLARGGKENKFKVLFKGAQDLMKARPQAYIELYLI